MDQEQTKFESFVREFGVEQLASRLGIEESAIYHWLRGATSPRRSHAFRIQKLALAKGVQLSLDEIYQHFRDVRRGRGPATSRKQKAARA